MRLMLRITTLLVALGAMALSSRGAPEAPSGSVTFAPRFDPETTTVYHLRTTTELSQAGGPITFAMEATLRCRLIESAGDHFVLGAQVAEVTLSRTAGGVTTSTSSQAAGVGPKPEEPEARSALRETADALAKATLRIEATPAGRVTGVTGMREVDEAARKVGRDGTILLQGLAPGSIARTLTLMLQLDAPGPDSASARSTPTARMPGQTWTLDRSHRLPLGGGIDSTATITFERIEAGIAHLSITGSSAVHPSRSGGDDAMLRAKVRPRKETESAEWDIGASQILRRRIESEVDTTVALGAGEIAASVKTAITIERVGSHE